MVIATLNLTFEEYLKYDNGTSQGYELIRGRLIEVTPPTIKHLLIAKRLERVLDDEINRLKLPLVTLREAGIQTEIDSSRLLDVCVVASAEVSELIEQVAIFRTPVKLAIEIVSPSSIKQDYIDKSLEYANKGISEYWIVDPLENKITMRILVSGRYEETIFTGGERIISHLFPELNLTVETVLMSLFC